MNKIISRIKNLIEFITIYQVMVFITLFYIFYPTNNSSLDAYAYAGDIKYAKNLFLPHHLIYNYFLYSLLKPFNLFFSDINTLLFTKYINAFFQALNLIIFYKILAKLSIPKKETLLYIIIIGFSFSLWRFGTENETYIIPITFSLIGSFYFLNFLKTKYLKYILYSGFFATIACLFHQIHFFWWFGLLIGTIFYSKKLKYILVYSITALIVPLAYSLVLIFYNNQELSLNNLIHFVFFDFYSGSAKTEFGWNNLILIIISSIRTFFQIHANIYFLIRKNFLFVIPILFIFFSVFKVIKLVSRKGLLKRRKLNENPFIKTHLLIFILQFLFAIYAVGNVEFIIMIPFLIFLSLFVKYKINKTVLILLALNLFIWNFSYGIFPNHYYKYYNDAVLVDFIINHPNDKFLVKNDAVLNQFYYKTGMDNYKNILLLNQLKSKGELYKLLSKNNIYTDIIGKPSIFNRGSITSKNKFNFNFNKFNKKFITSYKGLYGTSKIYQISKP
ncbi:hypothetical protein [Lutibacter sp.]|uniref:hypothetical protein n=1 Tax=Lutibacter sp. TaxID=1925666 RepID=UPI0025C63A10|nr:hypothetical protein [Lutibacter sp.]MCF6181424.1 hypothetical protein [Lutibacter sp.]